MNRLSKIRALKNIQAGKRTVASLKKREVHLTEDQLSKAIFGRPPFDLTKFSVFELYAMMPVTKYNDAAEELEDKRLLTILLEHNKKIKSESTRV